MELRRPPFAFAKRHGVIVCERRGDEVHVVCRDDVKLPALTELRRFVAMPLAIEQVDSEAFDRQLQAAYEGGSNMQMMEDIGDDDLFKAAEALAEPEDLLEAEDDAPIIRLINALLTEAIKENASDIHVEPYENRMVVRFRVDGVLREVLSPKRAVGPQLISRIKIMAKLDIAEKRVPQDGRISVKIAGRAVDVRVSTNPVTHGERVVLRLLDKQAGRLDLEHLGMVDEQRTRFDQIIHKPHGIILVTGPTGSGKTTTLYAGLSRLNDRQRNIMTVEDPVEYHLDGIAQTQVNTKVNMSFARGLRAILRQDPDVVMVGEIRDLETAEIAVQASLTGHLVLSTLHTNSAAGAVTRLRDMGIEPFLISSALLGILAQRLARTLCTHCKEPYQASESELKLLGRAPEEKITLHRATGCEHCKRTGFRGRTGIYELIIVDHEIRNLVHDGGSETAIEEHARQFGPSLSQDGYDKVIAGETTLDEVLRVTRES